MNTTVGIITMLLLVAQSTPSNAQSLLYRRLSGPFQNTFNRNRKAVSTQTPTTANPTNGLSPNMPIDSPIPPPNESPLSNPIPAYPYNLGNPYPVMNQPPIGGVINNPSLYGNNPLAASLGMIATLSPLGGSLEIDTPISRFRGDINQMMNKHMDVNIADPRPPLRDRAMNSGPNIGNFHKPGNIPKPSDIPKPADISKLANIPNLNPVVPGTPINQNIVIPISGVPSSPMGVNVNPLPGVSDSPMGTTKANTIAMNTGNSLDVSTITAQTSADQATSKDFTTGHGSSTVLMSTVASTTQK